jgi:2-polyprenyl-6-methoxyphenol hydroxylase-like FAD-dependent oxidoreductase
MMMIAVVAADGFRSRSELLIAGEHTPTRSSGMTVYRTAFPAHLAFADKRVRERWDGKHTYEFWMGSGMHIGLYLSPELVGFGITPRDEFLAPNKVARESWDADVDPQEVVDVLRRARVSSVDGDSDWHPVIEALVRTAPKGSLIHWPLLWRDLRRDWVSKGGRVVQIGDAAHSTVPASAAGGTLALEDAITLASCLQLAAAAAPGCSPPPCTAGVGVPLGTRAYNLLRYERASCTQKMAFVNAQALGHTTDWDDVRRNPEKVHLRYPKWLFLHNPEAYVYEKYGQAFAHLVNGAAFRNTNIPPGHKFVHWTLEQIHKEMAAGKRVEDLLDGDWT